jgi:hypothetical protein
MNLHAKSTFKSNSSNFQNKTITPFFNKEGKLMIKTESELNKTKKVINIQK